MYLCMCSAGTLRFRGDCLLQQVGCGDVWPERCPVAMGISGVVVHDCRLGGGGGGSRARR